MIFSISIYTSANRLERFIKNLFTEGHFNKCLFHRKTILTKIMLLKTNSPKTFHRNSFNQKKYNFRPFFKWRYPSSGYLPRFFDCSFSLSYTLSFLPLFNKYVIIQSHWNSHSMTYAPSTDQYQITHVIAFFHPYLIWSHSHHLNPHDTIGCCCCCCERGN